MNAMLKLAATCLCLILATPLQAQNYSDIWWNPLESGWGITIADHETQLFAVWFTYREDGRPTWFVIPGGTFSEGRRRFAGDIYQTTGPAFSAPFASSAVNVTRVGNATFDFSPPGLAAGSARYSYSIGTISASKTIVRQPFGDAPATWGRDFTDIWWNPSESGWGLALSQHGNNVFGVWYTYDVDGSPLFVVMPGATFAGTNRFSGPVFTTTGPWWGSPEFDPNRVRVDPAGNASLELPAVLQTGAAGEMRMEIRGASIAKAVVRQPFGRPSPSDLTSYDRFKGIGLTPQAVPPQRPATYFDSPARAYLDVDGDGVPELFVAEILYSPNLPQEAAVPSRFMFHRRATDGRYVEMPELLPVINGCLHPRKAAVADFNGDGAPDVFVACHGYDKPPFPGERNKVVLSQPDGRYRIQDASVDVGFHHSASAADFNGDGKPDVVVTAFFPALMVWLNDGTGRFTRSEGYLPAAATSPGGAYFTVETPDVDGDGKFDLFAGGHEWERAPTVVLINPGDSDFSRVVPVTLPAVPNEGIVLDVVVTGTGPTRALWVSRSSGGDGSFYGSATVQRVTWPGLSSTVPLLTRPGRWVHWIIPTVVNGQRVIASDDIAVTTVNLPY